MIVLGCFAKGFVRRAGLAVVCSAVWMSAAQGQSTTSSAGRTVGTFGVSPTGAAT
jgi:hypothetical protein